MLCIGTLLFIHSISNSLHRLIPSSQSFPLPCSPQANTGLFSMSVSLFLFHSYTGLYHILDFTFKWYDSCLSLSDLLCLVWDSLSPSVLLQMALFHSFYGWVVFHCICEQHLLYSFICQWTLGCFHVFAFVNSAAMNTGLHISFWIRVLSRYMAKNGITIIWPFYIKV